MQHTCNDKHVRAYTARVNSARKQQTFARAAWYLARVRIHDAQVVDADGALQHHLFHVAARDREAAARDVVVADDAKELLHVAQQLLRDALARGVDADLDVRGRVQHRRRKHAHADRLAEAARRAHKHFLRDMRPVVALQNLEVLPRKRPGRLELPEDARARLQEVVVEQPLVVAALPPALVEPRQRVPAPLHAREAGLVLARVCLALHPRLQASAHHRALLCRLDYHHSVQHAAKQLEDFPRGSSLYHLSGSSGVL